MRVRHAIVLLVVLIVAFGAIAVVGGTRRGSDSGSTTPSWVESVANIFSLSKPLDPAKDLGASSPSSCRAQFVGGTITLDQGVSCTLLVRKSTGRIPIVRTFSLTLAQGGKVAVAVEQPDSLTVKETLDSGSPSVDVKILKAGGSLQLDCVEGSCEVTIDL